MFRILFPIILIAISALGVTPAKAGIFICNDTGTTLYSSIGYQEDNTWQSRGWFKILPGKCAHPLSGALLNRYVYYYAHGGGLEYADGREPGFFCVNKTDAFHYRKVPGCFGHNFRIVDVGENSDQRTITLTENRTDPLQAARNCSGHMAGGKEEFAKCWMRQVATSKQRQILDCVEQTDSPAALAICATKGRLSSDGQKVAECAQEYAEKRLPRLLVTCMADGRLDEKTADLLRCASNNSASAFAIRAAGKQLSENQRRMLSCVADNKHDYKKTATCLLADRMSPQQQKIAQCVMNNRGSYVQMGVCAAGNSLTPEQQAFVECAVQTGGQPYAYAGCVGTRLTLNELDKCLSEGIGGRGCFGNNNAVVKFTTNAWKDVTEGPGPSHDLVGEDGALARTMRNAWSDITEGPGENNEICKIGLCF